jgi:hypothetical protein
MATTTPHETIPTALSAPLGPPLRVLVVESDTIDGAGVRALLARRA